MTSNPSNPLGHAPKARDRNPSSESPRAVRLTKGRVMYPTTRLILRALAEGPKTGRELAEILDEITPYVARTMASLRHRSGFVVNLRRGNRALYSITNAGRQALQEGPEHE